MRTRACACVPSCGDAPHPPPCPIKAYAMLAERTMVLDTAGCVFSAEILATLFNAPSWTDAELQEPKRHLNVIKSRLDDMQNRYGRGRA
jgi:hypothetical protein